MSTITLAIMARNAGDTLDAAIGPVQSFVDEIVVLLGGESDDDTEQIARKYTDKVVPYHWKDDFSDARNVLFSHCTSDYIFWIDADDVAENPEKLRDIAADADRNGWGSVQLRYKYAFDDDGNCIVEHAQHRLMRRSLGWQWGCSCREHPGRLHEVCYTDTPHAIVGDDRMTVVHQRPYKDGEDNPQGQRNLRLLRLMEEENPRCRRTRLAMGHCLFGMAKWQPALWYFQAYYQEPESDLERWHAACFAAKCCWNLQDWQGMANWAAIAVDLDPELKDGYLLRAQAEWWASQNPTRTLAWIASSEDKLEAPPAVFVTPSDYTTNRWDVEHRAYHALGMDERALEIVQNAMRLQPRNLVWRYYWRLYLESVRCNRSVAATAQIADHLVRRGDVLKAREFLRRYLPHTIEADRRIVQLTQRVERMARHLDEPPAYEDFYQTRDHTIIPDFDAEKIGWARFDFVENRFDSLRPKRVLDVACGNGHFDIRLAKKYGCEVVAIDVSRNAIAMAKRRLRQEPKNVRARVKFVVGNALMMDLEKFGRFDVALLLEVLEHMKGQDAQRLMGIVEEVAERVIATTPNETCVWGEGIEDDRAREHVREFSWNELAELISKRQDRRIVNLYKVSDRTADFEPGFGTWACEWDMRNVDMPRVVFYLGHGPEPWEPSWIEERGLGGSETAAVRMAEQFAALGFGVCLYADFEGIVNGVIYRNADRFNPAAPFLEVLPAFLMIGSRIPMAAANCNAQHRWLWMHDTDCGDALTPELAQRINRILVLSEWHKGHVLGLYPFLNADQVIVTGNGLHVWAPDGIERQRHRFVYASSPDRGLDVLLTWWPAILKKWPDAELHVFYGWQNYDAVLGNLIRDYPPLAPQMIAFKEKVIRLSQQPGVYSRGRIGQAELAVEFARAQFWLYPSFQADGKDWHETYCITAMEAQGNGCIPVTRRVGALPERCVHEASLVDSNIRHILKRLHWWDTRKPDELDKLTAEMRTVARNTTWERVATQWLAVVNADERARLEAAALADEKEVPVYV